MKNFDLILQISAPADHEFQRRKGSSGDRMAVLTKALVKEKENSETEKPPQPTVSARNSQFNSLSKNLHGRHLDGNINKNFEKDLELEKTDSVSPIRVQVDCAAIFGPLRVPLHR